VQILKILLLIPFVLSCSCSGDPKDNIPVVQNPPVENPPIDNPPIDPIPDEELLDLAQKDAIKYFWEFAETNSKLARERYHVDDPALDANLVTTGGSGFGLMTLIVGVERGFVNRGEAVTRMTTALNFLGNADRFHGAWSHWINGTNGHVIPFGNDDDGGDLVETSFLCQALICVREYFKDGNTEEQALAQKADDLWKGVDWNWYTRGGQNVLYWHWSPNYEWIKNFKLEGYNECLITYVMAAASPTHPINTEAYTQGWARNGAIQNGGSRYGFPVIFNYNGASGNVGPMFWAHYSYLGLSPKGLTDQYADYWQLTQNHTKIMNAYCIANPYNWNGYNENCWGLTASYTRNSNGTVGYTAHSPTNDSKGVITPTAALSSFPYLPEASMKALHHFYEDQRNVLIGPAGPYDAFSPHFNWVTKRYLAIDQGTIVPMIENHRTGLLWNLFMNAPEVKAGLLNLGFHSTEYNF
jgi:hypothetical protein